MRGHYIAAIIVLVAVSAVEARTWTNAEGKTLEADIVKVDGDQVYLRLAKDGSVHPLLMSWLSEGDQTYARQFAKDEAERQAVEERANRKAEWLSDYDSVKADATKLDLPILLLYTAPEWCGYCVKLENNILSQQAFEEYANKNLVLFIADFSQSSNAEAWKGEHPQLIKDFPCSGYPCVYLMTSDGKQLGKISGYDSEWSVKDYNRYA